MQASSETKMSWGERIAGGLIYLVIGLIIMTIFKPWGKVVLEQQFKGLIDQRWISNVDLVARFALIILLLAAYLFSRRSERLEKYAKLFLALLIMMIAMSIDLYSGRVQFYFLHLTDATPQGFAVIKAIEGVLVTGIIILLTWASGDTLGSIYLQKGNLKKGLIIGVIAFFAAAALSIPMGALFGIKDITAAKIWAWLPWILLFVITNAFMEELLLRGLVLRKLEPFTGKWLAVILAAIVFISPHLTVDYTQSMLIFGLTLIPLSIAWGWIMVSTDAIWGSFLFHAGMDIPIILGIFSQMK